MLNPNAPEFVASSTALSPTYYCSFSSPSSSYCFYHYVHYYGAAPYSYEPYVPNPPLMQLEANPLHCNFHLRFSGNMAANVVAPLPFGTPLPKALDYHASLGHPFLVRPEEMCGLVAGEARGLGKEEFEKGEGEGDGVSVQCVEGVVGPEGRRSSSSSSSSSSRRKRSSSRRRSNGKVVVSYWMPKSKSSQFRSVRVPRMFEFREDKAEVEGKTTVMIRNIPNKYSRNMLVDLLDKHCGEVNKQIENLGEERQPASTYDFVYLPMDFKNRCNLGYAFVNFTTAVATSRLYRHLDKRKWQDFCSKKICQITYARIQGKCALKAHFHHSNFACDSDEYLPVEFIPPRDGSCQSIGVTNGKRVNP